MNLEEKLIYEGKSSVMEKLFTEEMIMWIPVCCLSSIILNFIAVKFFRNTFCDRIDMSAEKESEDISLQSHDDMYELYINGVMEIFLSITCILGVCFFYDSVVSVLLTRLPVARLLCFTVAIWLRKVSLPPNIFRRQFSLSSVKR